MTVVFAKHGRSEADLDLLEAGWTGLSKDLCGHKFSSCYLAGIRNGAVLSDHGHACKYNWHNSHKLKFPVLIGNITVAHTYQVSVNLCRNFF